MVQNNESIINAVPHKEISYYLSQHESLLASQIGIIIFDASKDKSQHDICIEGNSVFLTFDDVETATEGKLMSQQQAATIKSLLSRFPTADIVVSCKGGICRSPAIAAAIYLAKYGKTRCYNRWFKTKHYLPNRYVFDLCAAELCGEYNPQDWDGAFETNRRIWDEYHIID